ncbi:FapA family protein [Desulfobacterota bacterium M19]
MNARSGKKSIDSLDDLYLESIKKKHNSADYKSPGLLPEGKQVPSVSELNLQLSADKMEAILRVGAAERLPALSEVETALKKLGVNTGIDLTSLQKLQASSVAGEPRAMIIAQGRRPGRRRTVIFNELQRLSDGGWAAGGFKFDFDRLPALLTTREKEIIAHDSVRVMALKPGDIVAHIEENFEAEPGVDVLGKEIPPLEDPMPEAGQNMEFDHQNMVIRAVTYGYLLVENEVFKLLPPIWITPDRMLAFYINLPQIGGPRYPEPEDIELLLENIGVVEACRVKFLIHKLCQSLKDGKKTVKMAKIAAAIPPKPGRDAEFSLEIEMDKKAGELRADGSIDLRERNAVVSVNEGMLVARKRLVKKGKNGLDLFARTIKASDGRDLKITTDASIRVEMDEENALYYAARTGNVNFISNNLTITDIFKVNGDVNYETGNLDVKSALVITGSVFPGFKVQAHGNLEIKGGVENGAQIIAQSDLIIGRGIMGSDSRIIVMGNLHTAFIQDAEILVRGNAVTASYAFNAVIRAFGSISILKGQHKKSGRAAGGIICSSKEIQASTVGSPSNAETTLAIKPEPELLRKKELIEDRINQCREGMARISRTLPFELTREDEIKSFLAPLTAEKKKPFLKLLAVFNKILKEAQSLKKERRQINEEIERILEDARIRITEHIFAGCTIQFGDLKLLLREEMGPQIFKYQNGKIISR